MSLEIKELMERIEPAREKIIAITNKCLEFISIYPNQVQKLVDLWSKVMETCPQKLSLLFLCNDLLRNTGSENLRSLFQFALPRAISLACGDSAVVGDLRKLIKMWGDLQMFPRQALDDWEKICIRAEQFGNKSDRSNLIHIISLGKKLRALRLAVENTFATDGEEKAKAAQEEHKIREELLKEIVACIKKVYHGHLNITICLQRLNVKLKNIDEIEGQILG
jgi:hypothetical protein